MWAWAVRGVCMYWLLLGFTGEDGVQVGEDATPAVVTTAGQQGLDRRPLVERFRRDHSGWRIRWDERTATPRTLTGPGIPLDQAAELVGRIAVLGAVDP